MASDRTDSGLRIRHLFLIGFVLIGLIFLAGQILIHQNILESKTPNSTHLIHSVKWITIATLSLTLLSLSIIFWRVSKKINNQFSKLRDAKKDAKHAAEDLEKLLASKDQSIKNHSNFKQAIEQNLLFARVTSKGRIIEVGKKFQNTIGYNHLKEWTTFPEFISSQKDEQEQIANLLTSKSEWQGEIKATNQKGSHIWLEMHIIPFSQEDHSEIMIISSDITKKKNADFDLEKLTKRNFEEKIIQQKVLSNQIIESQEKEQNRIAKDIHDGIGQMLTGLKLNIESIDLEKKEEAARKIEALKNLSKEIIQGVRTATFNLTPPELTDYGIAPALSKLASELSRLTNHQITFVNKTEFNQRLNSTQEINAYRVAQEATNNAMKYAQANYIIISLSHSKNMLSITIDDDGKGFPEKAESNAKSGGMGMTFMKERMSYIDGRLFINSNSEKGTRITLNIPI